MKGRRELRALALLILVFAVAAVREPRMLQGDTLTSILLAIPLLLVMAVGQMFIIASRGIDVSIGSTLGLSAMIVGMTFKSNPSMPVWEGALLGLAVGTAAGFLNSVFITWVRIPPIVATLGTLSAFRGLIFIFSKGKQVDSNFIPSALTDWSINGPLKIGSLTVPWVVVIAILAALVGAVLAKWTRFGRNIYAIGSHPEAAEVRGIPVGRTLMIAYTLCGSLAGFGGLLYASRYGFVNPGSVGSGMELPVIAATVIGGCDVRGGTGSIIGVALGCILLATIQQALAVLGIAADWQPIFYGAVILIALGFEAVLSRPRTQEAAA